MLDWLGLRIVGQGRLLGLPEPEERLEAVLEVEAQEPQAEAEQEPQALALAEQVAATVGKAAAQAAGQAAAVATGHKAMEQAQDSRQSPAGQDYLGVCFAPVGLSMPVAGQ